MVDYADRHTFDQAQAQIQHWLEVEYNVCRIHSTLDYATPAEIDAQWGRTTTRTLSPSSTDHFGVQLSGRSTDDRVRAFRTSTYGQRQGRRCQSALQSGASSFVMGRSC
ncbi:MAG: hypothetical protein ACYDBJ_12290 [Aggregatilineales bacterium]